MVIFEALVGCHDILILGKSPIKWRQRPDMTLAVDWVIKHQFKQIQKDGCVNHKSVARLSYDKERHCTMTSNSCNSHANFWQPNCDRIPCVSQDSFGTALHAMHPYKDHKENEYR